MDALGWRGNHIESFGESEGDHNSATCNSSGINRKNSCRKIEVRRRQYEQKSLASTAKQIINAGCGCYGCYGPPLWHHLLVTEPAVAITKTSTSNSLSFWGLLLSSYTHQQTPLKFLKVCKDANDSEWSVHWVSIANWKQTITKANDLVNDFAADQF